MANKILRLVYALIIASTLFQCVSFVAASPGINYERLDLSSNVVAYTSVSATPTLSVYGVRTSGSRDLLSSSSVSWASLNELILSVNSSGTVTFNNTGSFGIVEAKYKNPDGTIVSGRLVMHNKSSYQLNNSFTTVPSQAYLRKNTSLSRTGDNASLTLLSYAEAPTSFHRYDIYSGAAYNAVAECWFYDDGNTAIARNPGLYLQDNTSNGGCLAATFGKVITDSQYYSINNPKSGRASLGSGYLGTNTTTSAIATNVKASMGWHQLTFVMSTQPTYADNLYTANGKMMYFIDGNLVLTDDYVPDNIVGILLPQNNTYEQYYDDILMYTTSAPQPAFVSSGSLGGTLEAGQTVTANTTITEPENQTLGTTSYLWQTSPDNSTWTNVSTSGSSYTLTDNDARKYLKATITPSSTVAPTNGTPYAITSPQRIGATNDYQLDITGTPTMVQVGTTGQYVHVNGTINSVTTDLTGSNLLQYSSSDESVVTVSNSGLLTFVSNGFSVITVTDGDISASVLVSCYASGGLRGYNSFETAPNSPDHARTGSYCYANVSGNIDKYYAYNHDLIAEGWFYDTGSNNGTVYFQSCEDRDPATVTWYNTTYGRSAAAVFSSMTHIGINGASSTYYSVRNDMTDRDEIAAYYQYLGTKTCSTGRTGTFTLNGTNGMPSMPRSVGWHQVVMVLTGYSTDSYYTNKGTSHYFIDGVEVFTEDYVPYGNNVVRGEAGTSGNPAYYDDFGQMSYDTPQYTVSFGFNDTTLMSGMTYNTNGRDAVAINTTNTSATVNKGDKLTVNFGTPANEACSVDDITYGDYEYTTDANNAISFYPYQSGTLDANIAEIAFYVSPTGTGDGSISNPFGTLEDARNAVRNLRLSGFSNKAVVYLRGGEYYRTSTFSLTAADTNTVYCSYPGEKAVITGGQHLSGSKLTTVTDSNILNKVIDENARGQLKQIDLSGYFTTYPAMPEATNFGANVYNNVAQVYVNGMPLQKAKWPNDRADDILINSISTANNVTTVNFTNSNIYNRSALWSTDSLSHLWLEGHFARAWFYSTIKAASVTRAGSQVNMTFNSASYSDVPAIIDSPTKIPKVYVFNLIEEIDRPGESYLDEAGQKVYFMPYGSTDNADVVIPVANCTMLSANSSQDISVKGIDFEYNRGAMFSVSTAKGFKFDGCNFEHFTCKNALDGDNNSITNSLFYDGAQGGVSLTGGSGTAATGGGNVIDNCVFDSLDTLKMQYSQAVSLSGNNNVLQNSEVKNMKHTSISVSGSDQKILHNEIHHCVNWTGDMGAIYWGRNMTTIGVDIGYNYFHDNGSSYDDGWSQTIFCDDYAIGGDVHDNIFYRGSYGTSQGGGTSCYAIKCNGGMYMTARNNVFIDTPVCQFGQWTSAGQNKATEWWLACYSKAQSYNQTTYDFWTQLNQMGYFTSWQTRYDGTVWDGFIHLLDLNYYNSTLASLNYSTDRTALVAQALLHAPVQPNFFKDNVVIGGYSQTTSVGGGAVQESNIYRATIANGQSLFENFSGGDYDLTSAGLTTVRATIPTFNAVPMAQKGLSDSEASQGNAPVVSSATVTLPGTYAVASYTFTDSDGDSEGASTIEWLISTDGTTFTSTGVYGSKYLIKSADIGKYVKYTIVPVDEHCVKGASVTSSSTQLS